MNDKQTVRFEIELGGDAEVRQAVVDIYAMSALFGPQRIEQLTVEGNLFKVDIDSSEPLLYAIARIQAYENGGSNHQLQKRNIQWLAAFSGKSRFVLLNEQTTVAGAYAFSRFLSFNDEGFPAIQGRRRGLRIAYGMKKNLIETDGRISDVIRSSPNGLETNSYAMFGSLSSLLYYGMTDAEVYAQFLELTRGRTLFHALHQLTRHPFRKASEIYELVADKPAVYSPTLAGLNLPEGHSKVPNQWTLAIKFNDSGSENFMIGGAGYLVFDKNDRAWLTNNVRQGTPSSSTFCVVLEPDGRPAPFSPVFGGGALGAGFGVAVDPAGEKIYFGNYGWGPKEWNPQKGSITVCSQDGRVLSPPNGYVNGVSRAQGMAFDHEGNLWIASWGTQDPMAPADSLYPFKGERSAAVVYLKGDPERMLKFPFHSPNDCTFDVAIDDEGNAYVSNSGSNGAGTRSSVYKLRIVDGEIQELAHWHSKHKETNGVETLRQIAVGPNGHIYVAAVESNRVIKFDKNLQIRGELKKHIHAPWGLVFDRDGTLFVSNFAREMDFQTEDPVELVGPHGVTIIRNEDEETAELMTLPTGGSEVMLANGMPLYGKPRGQDGHRIPLRSFTPFMRLTGSRVDRAGNLWALNNWKPSAYIDVVKGNPGGDGVVVFLGVAAPGGDMAKTRV